MTDFQWITIVRDKIPGETWRVYAARASRKFDLSTEVTDSYLSNVARGLSPREAAISALDEYDCWDENRENIKVYNTRGEWIERPRILKISNALIPFIDNKFTFKIYRSVGNKHTEIVIDDSAIFALILVLLTVMEGMPPKSVRDACKEGYLSAKLLMRKHRAEDASE